MIKCKLCGGKIILIAKGFKFVWYECETCKHIVKLPFIKVGRIKK